MSTPTSRSARPGRLALAAALAALLLFAAPARASQTHLRLGQFGSAAQPSFATPIAAAVDPSGDLLVVEAGADRISRYHPDGTPDPFSALGSNLIDGVGPGADQTPENGLGFTTTSGDLYTQIAVDHSGTATEGDIYATQNTANGASTVHAIDVFAATGAYLGQLTAAGPTPFSAGGAVSPCGVAADSAGDLYVGGWFADQIYKFHPAANPPAAADLAATFSSADPCQLATGAGPTAGSLFAGEYLASVRKLDAATGALEYLVFQSNSNQYANQIAVDPTDGHLLIATVGSAVVPSAVRDYDVSQPSGPALVSTFAQSSGHRAPLAVAPASGRVYLGDTLATLDVYGPLVPVPDLVTSPATITGLDSATLNGTVNPDGSPLTDCHFDYLTDAAYQTNPSSNRFAGAATAICDPPAGSIDPDGGAQAVSANLSSLQTPGVVYHYRLSASNADLDSTSSPPRTGDERTLTTPDQPAVSASWATDVTTTEATLKAEINPKNAATTYHLDYLDDADFASGGFSNPATQHTDEAPVGTDDTDHFASEALTGLDPATTYHYRFVAHNSLGTTLGPDHLIHTYPAPAPPNAACPNQAFRTGPSAALPDCRAYEAVSPLQKKGDAELVHFGDLLPVEQATAAGDRLTYAATSALVPSDSAPLDYQFVASRDSASGWSTASINPPRDSASLSFPALAIIPNFLAFAPDLCAGFYLQGDDLALAPNSQPGLADLYRADLCGAGGYRTLTTASPTNPYQGTDPGFRYLPIIQGFSADGQIAVFSARGALTADADPDPVSGEEQPHYQLYVSSATGALRLLSVLPAAPGANQPGGPDTAASSLGWRVHADWTNLEDNVAGALSADGSRAYWSDDSALYLRVNPTRAPSPVSAGHCTDPTRACTLPVSANSAHFEAASPDGGTAIFLDQSGDLYSFDAAAAIANQPNPSTLIAGGVLGVLGASQDASRVYFLSTQDLGAGPNPLGDTAQPLKPNLYLYRAGQGPSFIATLDPVDHQDPELTPPRLIPDSALPALRTSRVSADGQRLAFTSYAPITRYDNLDAQGANPDAEVYLYDAAAGGGVASLLCASCNPTGARPSGHSASDRVLAQDTGGIVNAFAALLPGWNNEQQPTRALSAGGRRLFFEAYDALLPTDTNGTWDVYEWQAPGTGDCDTDNQNPGPLYFAQNGGCLALVSSDQDPTGDPTGAHFIDASADGSDVFLHARAQLVGGDSDDLIDVYDARIGGGFAQPPPPPTPCSGESCQGNPTQPPADPTPASGAPGPGNAGSDRTPDCSAAQSRVRSAKQRLRRADTVRERRVARKRLRRARHQLRVCLGGSK